MNASLVEVFAKKNLFFFHIFILLFLLFNQQLLKE